MVENKHKYKHPVSSLQDVNKELNKVSAEKEKQKKNSKIFKKRT